MYTGLWLEYVENGQSCWVGRLALLSGEGCLTKDAALHIELSCLSP